jgi:light-regulated signal transduction histidine kinase (bacteriophytochrome)
MLCPAAVETLLTACDQVLSDGTLRSLSRQPWPRPDRPRYFDWQLRRISGPDGSPQVLVFFVEITQHVTCPEGKAMATPSNDGVVATPAALSDSLRANDTLRRANQELEHFAAAASHDLQEPLRMVTSYLGLLRTKLDGKLDDTTNAYFNIITEAAERMRQLIQNLLKLARVGPRELMPTWFDGSEAVDEAINNLESQVRETAATITRDGLPRIFGDRTQVVLLFQNLIGNALKYRRPGEQPRIRIIGGTRDGDCLFSVSDNGLGIDDKHRQEIFTAFRRLHARDAIPGTGLGLTICQRIVHQHNGTIWVESEPGRGSTFFFTLAQPGHGDAHSQAQAEAAFNEHQQGTADASHAR